VQETQFLDDDFAVMYKSEERTGTLFFIGALVASLAIGLMAVIYKSIRVATANPVKAIKYE
jgi:urea transporter